MRTLRLVALSGGFMFVVVVAVRVATVLAAAVVLSANGDTRSS